MNRETVHGFDLALIATNHAMVNREFADWSPYIVDTRKAMAGIRRSRGKNQGRTQRRKPTSTLKLGDLRDLGTSEN
jgi:hypothetical protein